MPVEHPLLAQADEFIAALLAFEAAIPEPTPRAGELEIPTPGKHNRRPRKPGVVIVPGSGQNVAHDVDTITRHTPTGGSQTNSGPNTNTFEGLPNSGGGGGGAW